MTDDLLKEFLDAYKQFVKCNGDMMQMIEETKAIAPSMFTYPDSDNYDNIISNMAVGIGVQIQIIHEAIARVKGEQERVRHIYSHYKSLLSSASKDHPDCPKWVEFCKCYEKDAKETTCAIK